MEDFCCLVHSSNEQTEDFHDARINKDTADSFQHSAWFAIYLIFLQADKTISVASGAFAIESDICLKL